MKYRGCSVLLVTIASWAVGQQTSPPPETAPAPPGTVIFSRSVDENGKETPATVPAKSVAPADTATDQERQAITFVAYDLDVHLQPKENGMAVRARVTLRNDSAAPLHRLPLQLSSTLQWTGVRIAGAPAPFSQSLVDSDSDHTGVLREAIITLKQPLAPQQSLSLDLAYEGTAALSAERLEKIGTPPDVAQASDWDRVADDFIGLRGFGNVVWYPVASTPVALGDGAKFFTQAAAERQRQGQATVAMRVTEEFFGTAPNVAVLDGETIQVAPSSMPSATGVPGIITCSLPATRLGMTSPSLFLLARTATEGKGVTVFARTEDVENAQAYLTASTTVLPLVQQWLGVRPRGPLNIVDLPDGNDAPFEDGDVLFANVRSVDPDKLTGTLVHSLSHLYFRSPYAWLQEGVPAFLASLWQEQTLGRDAAIQQMDNARGALSLAEPGDAALSAPEATAAQTLLTARDPVYYRTKAVYVFWMLRNIAGDAALQQALQGYQPGLDAQGTEFERVLAQTSNKNLKWFFNDWVYRNRGLPDLSIAGIFPSKASVAGTYLVAVDVANSGNAEAEVPVSVSSGATMVTDRLRVPAKSRVSHRFLLQGAPAEVAVNDGTVPEVEASVHKQTLAVPPSKE